MDTCIALRTLVMQGNQAYVQAAPESWQTAFRRVSIKRRSNKAKGLLRAIEAAEGFSKQG